VRAIRKVLIAVFAALAALATAVVTEGIEAQPAAAAVTHQLRYDISTNNYRYDMTFQHHSNGVNTVNVHRFTLDGQYYISHDLSIQAYDYVCFHPYQWSGSNELSIYVWANAATDGVSGGSPCTFPWDTVNPNTCLPYHVYTRFGTYYGYSPSYNACPYSGYGNHAYGPNVLLQEQYPLVYEGATDTRADVFRFYT